MKKLIIILIALGLTSSSIYGKYHFLEEADAIIEVDNPSGENAV